MAAGTTRFDDALFDSDSFGFDIDTTVYVNMNSVEKSLLRGADSNLIRQDGTSMTRDIDPRTVRRQE